MKESIRKSLTELEMRIMNNPEETDQYNTTNNSIYVIYVIYKNDY